MTGLVAGVFVGGAGVRLGGKAKGLLAAPDGGTLLDRWRVVLADLAIPIVLVGRHGAYDGLGLEHVDDEPSGIGPLGGLVGLLRRAGTGRALALACDMPFVSRALVEALVAFAASAPSAPVVAPRRDGRWEPLCALYDGPRVLPLAVARAAGPSHSLQGLLDEAGALELPLDASRARELADWDTPGDLAGKP